MVAKLPSPSGPSSRSAHAGSARPALLPNIAVAVLARTWHAIELAAHCLPVGALRPPPLLVMPGAPALRTQNAARTMPCPAGRRLAPWIARREVKTAGPGFCYVYGGVAAAVFVVGFMKESLKDFCQISSVVLVTLGQLLDVDPGGPVGGPPIAEVQAHRVPAPSFDTRPATCGPKFGSVRSISGHRTSRVRVAMRRCWSSFRQLAERDRELRLRSTFSSG